MVSDGAEYMARCETCGNEYDKPLEVKLDGKTYTFDCFECAIHSLAPACAHCGCKILGHGVENEESIFCCAHCARSVGEQEIVDRVEHA